MAITVYGFSASKTQKISDAVSVLFSVVRFSVSLASGEIEVPPRVSPAGRCTSASHCQKCNGVGMGNTVHSKQKTLLLNVMLIFGVFCLMIFVVLLMHC